ncbi:MAG: metal-sulfur cluster assembly factor [Myxococcaceae bacterium]
MSSERERLRAVALETLRDVIDPEVGLNIVDLGLVYGIDAVGGSLQVQLTMTTPACPLGEQIQRDAEERLRTVAGVDDVTVELVWEPAWTPDRISAVGKQLLGWAA